MDETRHPTDIQRVFFEQNVLGEQDTVLSLKVGAASERGFAINILGPFQLSVYQFLGSSETVIDASWAGPPESKAHMHCCWSEVRFAQLTATNEAVQRNIGFQWQLSFFATAPTTAQMPPSQRQGAAKLFWFYLKDEHHKAVRRLSSNQVLAVA